MCSQLSWGNLILDSRRYCRSWRVMWTRESPRAATMLYECISYRSYKSSWAQTIFQSDWFWQRPQFWTTTALRFPCRFVALRWADCFCLVWFYVMIVCRTRSTLWITLTLMSTFNDTKWRFKPQVSHNIGRLGEASKLIESCFRFQCRLKRENSSQQHTQTLSSRPSKGDGTWGKPKFSIAIVDDVEMLPSFLLMGAPGSAKSFHAVVE